VEAVLDGLDLQNSGSTIPRGAKRAGSMRISQKAIYEAGSLPNSANISWKANG